LRRGLRLGGEPSFVSRCDIAFRFRGEEPAMPLILNVGRAGPRERRTALLQDSGFEVIDAGDAKAALALAEQRPSLVVVDAALPRVDGIEVCRRLRADHRTRFVPVLLLSETPLSPQDSVRALASGVDWCLSDCESPAVLADSVKALIYRRNSESRDPTSATMESLPQAQKMEAIGHLAFGVAHDFNNLLTAILGYTDMMLSQIGNDKPISADLMEIRKAADRAASLTRQLLAFSRKQPLSVSVIDLNSVVADADQFLQRLIGEHIRLQTRLASDLWAITGDITQLEQILLNLVVNARDAMPAGGSVFIETSNVVLTNRHRFPDPVAVVPGRYALLMVQDTGCGMDERTRARLFEPFFTTKGRGRGTGLGLATVYGIVKHLKGYIFAESESGRGTTFRLYLPAVVDVAASAATSTERMPPFVGRETILVVEDDDVVRRFATVALQRYGYAVLEAATPERALEIADESDQPIHLILTDVIMPGLSGPAFVQRLRQRRSGTPVIYMSGYPGDAMVAPIVTSPGDVQLTKPFATGDLLRTVRRILDNAKNS
jgi:two-component system cell cycle sensor histidine kinase/response regulator CckA